MLQGGGGVITIYSHVLRDEVQYAVLPIRESVLHLTEIAEYWSRGLSRERTQPEIYAELLDDFWHGELAAVHVHDHHPIDRESVLKAINSTRNLEHPGFTLIESPESIPPKVKQHQDGSVTALKEGIRTPGVREELEVLEAKKRELLAMLKRPVDLVPQLHPRLADLYREKVARLRDELNCNDIRTEAAEVIRDLIQESGCCPRMIGSRSISRAISPRFSPSGTVAPAA